MARKVDWVIHAVVNGLPCHLCGKTPTRLLPNCCNAHTHGMAKYDHMDFQLVLNFPPHEIARILNTLGLRVQDGEQFKNGDLVVGIYEDCDVRLTEFDEDGRTVLRVVIPDTKNRFPDNPECSYPYTVQALPTDALFEDSKPAFLPS